MILDMPRTTILFRGGQYGMYLQWILYTLLVDQPIKAPFLRSKNSPKTESTSHNMSYINPDHIKQGILIPNYDDINIHASARQLRNKNLKLSTMIYWGWNDPFLEDEYVAFANQIKLVSEIVDRVIIPYVDHSTYLLSVHNLLYKTNHNGIYKDGPLKHLTLEDLYTGWNVDQKTAVRDIPRWILREHHSMNIFNYFNDDWDWPVSTKIFKRNCHFVFLSDLFYNFLSTIESIRQFLDIEWVRDPAELLPYHKINIANQQHKKQDIIATQILQSINDGTNFTWNSNDITLYTEAYIQRALQDQGILLQCNELNNFPTSTNALIEVFE